MRIMENVLSYPRATDNTEPLNRSQCTVINISFFE